MLQELDVRRTQQSSHARVTRAGIIASMLPRTTIAVGSPPPEPLTDDVAATLVCYLVDQAKPSGVWDKGLAAMVFSHGHGEHEFAKAIDKLEANGSIIVTPPPDDVFKLTTIRADDDERRDIGELLTHVLVDRMVRNNAECGFCCRVLHRFLDRPELESIAEAGCCGGCDRLSCQDETSDDTAPKLKRKDQRPGPTKTGCSTFQQCGGCQSSFCAECDKMSVRCVQFECDFARCRNCPTLMCKGCGVAFCDCEEIAHCTCNDCGCGFCNDCLLCADCNADNECDGDCYCRACHEFICESCAANRIGKCENCDRSFCEFCASIGGECGLCGKTACVDSGYSQGEGVSVCLVICDGDGDGDDRVLCSGCRPNLDQPAPTARRQQRGWP